MARADLGLSAEAVACAPQTTGLLVTIDTCVPGGGRGAFSDVLEGGIFTAGVRVVSDAYDVCVWYTDRTDVEGAYREFRAQAPRLEGTRRVHEGMYVPSIGRYEYYA